MCGFLKVIVCFGGPCSVMTFCYVQILRELHASKRRTTEAEEQNKLGYRDDIAMSSGDTAGTPSTKANVHSISETISEPDAKYEENVEQKENGKRQVILKRALPYMVIVLVFVVCWLPFCVTMFWSVYSSTPVPRIADMTTLLLGYFNSCCNPFLYGLLNKELRLGFSRLLC